MDTALFVVTAGEGKEDSNVVCITEQRDKEVSLFWHQIYCVAWSKNLKFKKDGLNPHLRIVAAWLKRVLEITVTGVSFVLKLL